MVVIDKVVLRFNTDTSGCQIQVFRIPYAERELATESGDTQWSYWIAGLSVTKLSAATRRQIQVCLTDCSIIL